MPPVSFVISWWLNFVVLVIDCPVEYLKGMHFSYSFARNSRSPSPDAAKSGSVTANRMLETFERLKIYTIKWNEKLNAITNLIMYVSNNKKNPWLMPPTLLVLLSYF